MSVLTYLRRKRQQPLIPAPTITPSTVQLCRRWTVILQNDRELQVDADALSWGLDGRLNEDGTWQTGTLLAFNDEDAYAFDPAAVWRPCPPQSAYLFTTSRKAQMMGNARPLPKDTFASQLRRQSKLVYDLMAFMRRYVVMSREQLLVTALWIIHTHCIEHVEQTPYLAVTSPEKRCGKSRLLETIEFLSARPWSTIMPSEAVVYRKVHADVPTMLLDEVDAIFNPKNADRYEGLRALLNNGHRYGAKVPRCIGVGAEIAEFNTFCPKVIAGIGALPDTVADRAIPIRLARKTRQEPTEQFKRRQVKPDAEALRKRIEQWAKKSGAGIASLEPDMPGELNDRAQEGCEALVAIADLMGCGAQARTALVSLFTAERLDDQESMRIRLLSDIRAAFDRSKASRLSTDALLNALIVVDDAPWHNYYGRELDARDLSTLLRHYGIKPTTVRLKDKRPAKGYKREFFHEAWERYL